jgi:hypothetical protein
MNLALAVKYINSAINKKQPTRFSDQWIKDSLPGTYKYIRRNIRTVTNDVDWDKIISSLDRKIQKRWNGITSKKPPKKYNGKREVNKLIKIHRNKLYTFINPLNEQDRHYRDIICIYLVRLAQKGNTHAEQQVILWSKYVIEEWMEKSPTIGRWLGYSDRLKEEVKNCIRRYRYTGSFLGYLYRTLYYIGRSLRPICKFSLDEIVLDGHVTRLERFFVKNNHLSLDNSE